MHITPFTKSINSDTRHARNFEKYVEFMSYDIIWTLTEILYMCKLPRVTENGLNGHTFSYSDTEISCGEARRGSEQVTTES